jgi:hypothetical protein
LPRGRDTPDALRFPPERREHQLMEFLLIGRRSELIAEGCVERAEFSEFSQIPIGTILDVAVHSQPSTGSMSQDRERFAADKRGGNGAKDLAGRTGLADESEELQSAVGEHQQFVVRRRVLTLSFPRDRFLSVVFDFCAAVLQLDLARVESPPALVFRVSLPVVC